MEGRLFRCWYGLNFNYDNGEQISENLMAQCMQTLAVQGTYQMPYGYRSRQITACKLATISVALEESLR